MEKCTTKITVPGTDLIQNSWRNIKLFREAKVKRIQYHQTSFTKMLKEVTQSEIQEKKRGSTKSTPSN